MLKNMSKEHCNRIGKAHEMIWKYKRGILKRVIAELLHDKYEELSKQKDWNTQRTCQVKFKDLPNENKEVMFGMAEFVMELRKMQEYKIFEKGEDILKVNESRQ